MPTNLFLASAYTYDTVVFCFFTLGCVIWANEMFFYKRKNSIKEILLMTALFTIGSVYTNHFASNFTSSVKNSVEKT